MDFPIYSSQSTLSLPYADISIFFSSALRGGKTINNSEKARAGGRHTFLSREINEKKSGLAERNSAADRGRDAFVRSAGRKKIQ